MKILGIDPGPEESAFVLWDTFDQKIWEKIIIPSEKVCHYIENLDYDALAIEDIILYGFAPAGRSTSDTLKWIGEFRCWNRMIGKYPVHFITRPDVVKHFCHNSKAKKSNVNLMLRERFGSKGTKRNPGLMYGLDKGGTGHMFDAFAVAVTCWDLFYKHSTKNEK